MNTENDPMARPLSPVERMQLVPVCRDLGINMVDYTSDRALCQAITEAVLAEVAAAEPDAPPGIECDSCHAVKPVRDFLGSGHLPGGQCNGYDIDSSVCNECAKRELWEVLMELYGNVAETSAEEGPEGV